MAAGRAHSRQFLREADDPQLIHAQPPHHFRLFIRRMQQLRRRLRPNHPQRMGIEGAHLQGNAQLPGFRLRCPDQRPVPGVYAVKHAQHQHPRPLRLIPVADQPHRILSPFSAPPSPEQSALSISSGLRPAPRCPRKRPADTASPASSPAEPLPAAPSPAAWLRR